MTDIKSWIDGLADEAAGLAKRALGELTARPDFVLAGEQQQALGRKQVAAAPSEDGARPAVAIGWQLEPGHRAALLARHPPRYGSVIADHVTLAARVPFDAPLPPPCSAELVGRSDDGEGVETLIVAIDGSPERPDGGTFHMTWSLAAHRRSAESNDVIARRGWTPLRTREAIALHPVRF